MNSGLYLALFIVFEIVIYFFLFNKLEQFYLFEKPKYNDPDFFGIPYHVLIGPFNRFLVVYLLIEHDTYWLIAYMVISIVSAMFNNRIHTKMNYIIGKSISIVLGLAYYFVYSNTYKLF